MTTTTSTADATFCYSIDAAGGRVFIQLLVGMCAQLGRDSVALAVTLEAIGEDGADGGD
jgi:hypothetical protein